MGQRRTEEQIEEILRLYEARGRMSKRAFCDQHGIGVSTLGYHLQRRAEQSVRLARVKVAAKPAHTGGRYTLVLENGRRIECGAAELPHLISAAERR